MARPKSPKGNTTPRRYTGGRPPRQITVEVGTERMKTLRTLAKAERREPEALAAELLGAAIAEAWEQYERELGVAAGEAANWEGEVL